MNGNRSVSGGGGKIKGHCELLIYGIGGHDCLAGQGGRLGGISKQACHGCDAGGDPVQRHVRADDAGGADQYGIRGDPQYLRGMLSGFAAKAHAFRTGAGVGNAGVDDHSPGGLSALNNLHIPEDRSGFHLVGGEGAGDGAGHVRKEQSHVPPVLILDARLTAGSFEPFGSGETAGNLPNLHHSSPVINCVIFSSFSTNS